MTRPVRSVRLGSSGAVSERRRDGAILLRSRQALPPFPAKLTEKLEHWAAKAPERVLFAQRAGSSWRTLTYRDARDRARRVAAALLQRKLSAERPPLVLSGNDLEHALLHLGAMYAGVPYAPVSPAYSVLSTDFAKLRAIFELLTPGLVFARGARTRP